MGCDFKGRSRYSECPYSIETEIREWELKLGTFDRPLFEIISRINAKLLSDAQNIPRENLIHFFNLEFKENAFKEIIDKDIFKIGGAKEGSYDPDMFRTLFFLLTKSNVSSNATNNNQDKAKFLYSALKDDTEELDTAIDRENPALIRFLQTCINLSTLILVGKLIFEFRCLCSRK